jgi:hypothetical protein
MKITNNQWLKRKNYFFLIQSANPKQIVTLHNLYLLAEQSDKKENNNLKNKNKNKN